MANPRSVVSCALILCALSLSPNHGAAEPQNGWWWNPNESGRGYFIEMTGGVFYLAGYFYESNGRATWMSASGAVTDLYSISGTLQSYRNGQSMFGAYRRPDPAVDVGTISITFKDDSHGTLTWPGGTVPIVRQVFDEDVTLLDLPKTGWWWNPAESGSGYSVEIQGSTIFVVAFMYDEIGNPIWYLTAGALSSPTHYDGDWLEYSGGQTMAGSYRAPTSRNLGRVTIDFAAIDQGSITFTEGATAKHLKKATAKQRKAFPRSRLNSIYPQFSRNTGAFLDDRQNWPQFLCELNREIVTRTAAGTTGTFKVTQTWNYLFRFDYLQGSGRYTVNDVDSFLDYTYTSEDTSNGCTASARKDNYGPLFGELRIDSAGGYKGDIFETIAPFIEVVESCPDSPQSRQQRPLPVAFGIGGRNSSVQAFAPFPGSPLPSNFRHPYMTVRNSLVDPAGCNDADADPTSACAAIKWGWDCVAHMD